MSVICQYLIFLICSLKSKEFSAKYLVTFLDKHINIQGEWAVKRVPLDYIIHLAHFYRQNDNNNATRKTT